MKQTITIVRFADRHLNPHGRDFADMEQIVVDAGEWCPVLEHLPLGRYSIQVSEPYDEE